MRCAARAPDGSVRDRPLHTMVILGFGLAGQPSSNPDCSNLRVRAFSETVRTLAGSKPRVTAASMSTRTVRVTPGAAARWARISSAIFLKSVP